MQTIQLRKGLSLSLIIALMLSSLFCVEGDFASAATTDQISATTTTVTVTASGTQQEASSLQVRLSRSSSMKKATSKTIEGSGGSVSFKSLTPFTKYYVQTRGNQSESWSNPVSIYTKRASKKQILSAMNASSNAKRVKTFRTDYSLSSTQGKALTSYVSTLRKKYKIRFVLVDLKTGEGISCEPGAVVYSASCLKGPYVASLCKYKPSSYQKSLSLMRPTVTVSNNETYKALHNRYGSSSMKKFMKFSGVSSWNPARRYTYVPVRDLGKLWVGAHWYFYRSGSKNSKSAKCRALLTHGTQSFIYGAMKGKHKVHTKPGWYPGGGFNVQNDAGIVTKKVNGRSHPYVICVMSSACGQHKKLRKLVTLLDAVHTDMVKER